MKKFSPRVSNESKAIILIIYCRMNAQADLSHIYIYANMAMLDLFRPICVGGAQWLSGRASDSGARSRGSKPTSGILCR